MAENGLNACFGGISRTTQTFAVRTAVLTDYKVGKLWVRGFYVYRKLKMLLIFPHMSEIPPFIVLPMAMGR